MVDVKREKELDEKRKNEKLTVPAEHPVRKLLFRMRERHGTRIFPSQIFADIEKVHQFICLRLSHIEKVRNEQNRKPKK